MTQVSYCFLPLVRPPENDRTSNQRQLLVDHLKPVCVMGRERFLCVALLPLHPRQSVCHFSSQRHAKKSTKCEVSLDFHYFLIFVDMSGIDILLRRTQ